MQFADPPLLELIAELKWLPHPPGLESPGFQAIAPMPLAGFGTQDEFFSAFSKATAQSGWTASERLFPVGFPLVSYQPAVRIRSFNEKESQMLYQVGAGVFSAHAVPPYKNWESFKPFAERGLDILLRTRSEAEKQVGFFSVSLRYLDLFSSALTHNASVGKFLTDTLGFSLGIPPVLTSLIAPQGECQGRSKSGPVWRSKREPPGA